MPILLNKKNIQGLPVAERVNYDFVKATTLTDLLHTISDCSLSPLEIWAFF